VMESIGLSGQENAGKRLTVLRSIDKWDKFGPNGVRLLLGEGRRDESGDFTKGAGLEQNHIESILLYLGSRYAVMGIGEGGSGWKASFQQWRTVVKNSDVGMQGVDELEEIAKLFWAANYRYDRMSFDSSVVRGLEYYTGPVYEVELALPIEDEKGRPVQFGSVGGGGRYDGLVSRFRGQPVPATGFSIGVSRLQDALTRLGKIDTRPSPGPVVVTVFGGDVANYQRFVAALRDSGIRAELYLGNPKNNLGVQFKYADRRNSPCVVVQGSDEKDRGVVVIKDLIAGTEAALFHGAVGTSREEYLEERAGQFTVPERDLVEAVIGVLRRHGVTWG